MSEHIEIIKDIEQGSPEWFAARAGWPTASNFACLTVKKGKGPNGESVERIAYMERLAAEIVLGKPILSDFKNEHMERGNEQEADARATYAFKKGVEPVTVALVKNHKLKCAASPDALIYKGDTREGGLEIKSVLPHIQLRRWRENALPKAHAAQVQGNMMVNEVDYWDFASYCPDLEFLNLELFEIRVYRDDHAIRELADEVDRFNAELEALVEKLRAGRFVEAAA